MSEPTYEHEISLSPLSRLGVSLKSASLLPGRSAVLFFSRSEALYGSMWSYLLEPPYKARCNEHALALGLVARLAYTPFPTAERAL